VIKTIPVGDFPVDPEYNEFNNQIYVANLFGGVSVIDPSTREVIKTIPVGVGAFFLEFNPSNKNMYVSHPIQETVSVILTSYP